MSQTDLTNYYILLAALDKRPTDLEGLVSALLDIHYNCEDFVSCTVPPHEAVYFDEFREEESRTHTGYVANKLELFFKHCRSLFTENTIRALSTLCAIRTGSIEGAKDASRNQPYYNLSLRPVGNQTTPA